MATINAINPREIIHTKATVPKGRSVALHSRSMINIFLSHGMRRLRGRISPPKGIISMPNTITGWRILMPQTIRRVISNSRVISNPVISNPTVSKTNRVMLSRKRHRMPSLMPSRIMRINPKSGVIQGSLEKQAPTLKAPQVAVRKPPLPKRQMPMPIHRVPRTPMLPMMLSWRHLPKGRSTRL